MKLNQVKVFFFFFLSFTASAQPWIEKQAEVSLKNLLANIAPPGTSPGVVIASPSKKNPDYFYHWVRDAAIVMSVVTNLYASSTSPSEKKSYLNLLIDYVDFSRKNQLTQTQGSLGEPKFFVDGTPFNDPWGRPQDDGPALRALALSRLARLFINEGQVAFVKKKLYDGAFPTQTVVKADLEYVANHWQQPCFDLWEEVSGRHFYTALVQHSSLIEGAELAGILGDTGARDYYLRQAKLLENEFQKFWDSQKEVLVPTVNRNGGLSYKNSGLDTAIILGVLHAYIGDGFFSFSNEQVLSTFQKIETSFRSTYPINQKLPPSEAIAIGRYPEDKYDGTGVSEGNPWFLTTLAFGEFLNRAAIEYRALGSIVVSRLTLPFFESLGLHPSVGTLYAGDPGFNAVILALRKRANAYIDRVEEYASAAGNLSEQINRHTGQMQGAPDLTWSYGAFITAYWSTW